ncbi:MAG TPA: hypothetical protein VJ742_08335, partial [Nitrososphaera sp.]|nr:hypothetical protein [Nitrososphaera sp.]
ETHGVEAFYEHFLFKNTLVQLNYTRTLGENLIDVAGDEAGVALRFHQSPVTASVRGSYRADHRINVFSLDTFATETVNEDGYFRVDATIGYKVRPNVELYAKLENAFSENYVDGGYRQPGFKSYFGTRVEF